MWQEQKGKRPQPDRRVPAAGGQNSGGCGSETEESRQWDGGAPVAAARQNCAAAAAGQRELTGGAGKMYK